MLKKECRWRIEEDSRVHFWLDNWIPNISPNLLGAKIASAMNVNFVSELIDVGSHSRDMTMLNYVFLPYVIEHIVYVPLSLYFIERVILWPIVRMDTIIRSWDIIFLAHQ